MWARQKQSQPQGFTIVELLIVIVVIGILAAITIVAFNGVRDRSQWARVQSELASINKAIKMYHAQYGEYPSPTATPPSWGWRYSCATDPGSSTVTAFIAQLSAVSPNLPQAPCTDSASTSNDTWLYGSDGAEYKLIHIRPNLSSSIKSAIPAQLRDAGGGNRWSANGTWGYWSEGAATR